MNKRNMVERKSHLHVPRLRVIVAPPYWYAAVALGIGGKVLNEEGKVFHNTNGTVVRKALKSGEKIDRHNHEGEDIIFNVMSGKITVTLNDGEVHELNAGDTLVFNGKNYISAVAGADTVVVITLVKE